MCFNKKSIKFYDNNLKKIKKNSQNVEKETVADKGEYKHFILKEIFEQPNTVKNYINEYIDSIKKN